LAPMLTIRGGGIVEGIAELIGRTPGLRGMIVKPRNFREQCYAWQASGRAGFCDYRYEHTVALVELEDLNQEMYRERPWAKPTQIVGAGDEKYISNDALVRFIELQRASGPVELCFLPDTVPHEMLTPYENVGREMHWLEDLLRSSVRFVVNGEFFPAQNDEDRDQALNPACRLGEVPAAL